VIAVVFWGLHQADLPLVRFIRSFSRRWVDLTGDIGSVLGSGPLLTAISALMLLAGLFSVRHELRAAGGTRWRERVKAWWAVAEPRRLCRAGTAGLLAHAVAALSVHLLKHVIGRPRPRLSHGDDFRLGPSYELGLDSFPSGHATASCAVAAVIARHYPRASWLVYGVATFIAATRVWRNSHFLTDVLGGVCLGLTVGTLIGTPVATWRSGVRVVLRALSSAMLAVFALVWTALHLPSSESLDRVMLALSGSALALGIAWRLYGAFGPGQRLPPPMPSPLVGEGWVGAPLAARLRSGNALIWLGLALMTGSLLVTALMVLLLVAAVFDWGAGDQAVVRSAAAPPTSHWTWVREAGVATAVVLGALILHGLKGLLPIL
jgi:undecaprenyl-diphosphatase